MQRDETKKKKNVGTTKSRGKEIGEEGAREQFICALRGKETRVERERRRGQSFNCKATLRRPFVQGIPGYFDDWYLIKGGGGIPITLKFNWRRV